eukprot:5912733-Amphidinium_carterae.1
MGNRSSTSSANAPLAYDHPLLASRCYPRGPNRSGKSKSDVADESLFPDHLRTVIVKSTSGHRLFCAWADFTSKRKPARRVLLYFHGNGELAWQSAEVWAEQFSETMGLDACFFAEYRGYGASEGEACLCDMQDDLPAILQSITEQAGQPVPE